MGSLSATRRSVTTNIHDHFCSTYLVLKERGSKATTAVEANSGGCEHNGANERCGNG